MTDPLQVLEERISEVGYWRWWDEPRPDVFQVEFGGVQLYFPPRSLDQPPNSVVALCFYKPSIIAFLTKADAKSVEPGWHLALHEEKLEPFSVDSELFTLTSEEILQSVATGCSVEYLIGNELAQASEGDKAMLAFRAHEVGLIVRAAAMTPFAVRRALSPEQVTKAADDWFDYWREYWGRRDSASAVPYDYACEVTIPIEKYLKSPINLRDV